MSPFGNRSLRRALAAFLVLPGGTTILAKEGWLESKAAHYSVFYQSGFEQDVPRVRAWAKSHRTLFSCCAPDLHIGDDYNGGAAFVTFLADEFGEDVHARILRSTAPTFAGALTEATKPYSRAELFARFEAWLARP